MDSLYRGQWEHTTDATESLRRQASELVAAHLQWHLERQLRTLPLIERATPHSLVSPNVRGAGDGATVAVRGSG